MHDPTKKSKGHAASPGNQSVVLEPWSRLTLRSEPGQWTARMAEFEGGFICEPARDGGTRVTHYEEFHFHRVLRSLAKSFLADWLQDDIDREMHRLKELIEA